MKSVGALADAAATRLARMSLTDPTLREAIQTVKLGPNSVRVGSWDIIRKDDKTFTICSAKNGDVAHEGIAFYDTAQSIVRLLNRGLAPRAFQIMSVVMTNGEYTRQRDEAEYQLARARDLWPTSPEKAERAEDLHSVAYDRAHQLYKRLPVPTDF
jgi:hypothetical protein